MQTIDPVYIQIDTRRETKILHFSLPGLLPKDSKLALSLETRTLSLISDGPRLLVEEQLSANEMCMLVPIVSSFPHYCPYEVLLCYMFSKVVTDASIAHCRQHLHEAQSQGTWLQELRPIRRAISSLRTKLSSFNLGISNIREGGCSLIGLPSSNHTQPLG
jgi:hypothetical protein